MTPLQLTWRPATCDPRTSEEPGRQEKTREDNSRQECTNHFRINLAVIQPSCHLFTRALFCCHCKCNLWSFSFAIFKVKWTEREEIPKIWGELDSLGNLLNLTHLWGTFKSAGYIILLRLAIHVCWNIHFGIFCFEVFIMALWDPLCTEWLDKSPYFDEIFHFLA